MASPSPPGAPSLRFAALLGATLEAILHELLYSRAVYPPESFALHRHLSVRCHASRVPPVGAYVADFLRVAVPSVVAGVADSVSVVVLEEEVARRSGGSDAAGERTGGTRTVERFVFQFHVDGVIGGPDGAKSERQRNHEPMDIEDDRYRGHAAVNLDRELADKARAQLERSLRECLLRVLTLRRRRRRRDEKAENMSFKLCLHVAGDKKDEAETREGAGGEDWRSTACPELMEALRQGDWLVPEASSCLFSSTPDADAQQNGKGLLRPIKDVDLPSCGLKMQIGMEVNPF